MSDTEIIRKVLAQRCQHEREYLLSRTARLWLTFKALVCMALGRYSTEGDPFDYVIVAVIAGGTSHHGDHHVTTYWQDALIVSMGWRNWWFGFVSDSSD